MNCSWPTMPILVSPSRCAEAMTMATLRYFTSLFGRRCTSGCSCIAAALRMRASSSGRPLRVSPFQISVPSKSTSMVITCGGALGGGVPTGMLSFTACVWIGMVMISMMISTSITSISGGGLILGVTSASCTSWVLQKALASRSMAMTMFSGLVCVGRLRSRGRSTGTFWITTGMVIRKMISSTSITSTSGVVLICEFRSSSSACPTVIAMSDHLVRRMAAAEQRHLYAAAEAPHVLHRDAVAPYQPVVAEHRRHRDRKAERGHDQRVAHRCRHLVDRRLAGDADRGERGIDAPHRAEQADEGRRRAHRGQEGKAGLQPVVDHVDRAVERHREPGIQIDLLLGHRGVILDRDQPFLGDEAERTIGAQPFYSGLDALGGPELLIGLARILP